MSIESSTRPADDAPPDGGAVPPAAPARARIVVPRWVQIASLPALLLIGWFLLGAVGQAVFIFLFAGLLALVLNPLVHLLERIRVPRYIGVFVVYLAFVALLVGIAALIIPPLVEQARGLADEVPAMANSARSSIDQVQRLSDRIGLNIDVAAEVDRFSNSVDNYLPAVSRSIYGVGRSLAGTITIVFLVIVISIYMLLDAKRLSRVLVDNFPTGSRADGEAYAAIARGAVINYVKAQVLLSAALGASAGFAMYILGVTGVFPSGDDYALFFGAWTAVMELIPYLGPVLAAVPPSFVALLDSPLTMVWVILTYLAIQQIEGHILTPTIMGQRFRVHPLLVIFVILAGNEIHGVAGMFLAIPLIPLVKETYVFMRPRLRFAGWNDERGDVLTAEPRQQARPGDDL
jgi:putative heme transporter